MAGTKVDVRKQFAIKFIQRKEMVCKQEGSSEETSDELTLRVHSIFVCIHCKMQIKELTDTDAEMRAHIKSCGQAPLQIKHLFEDPNESIITLNERICIMEALKHFYVNKFYHNYNILFEKVKEQKWVNSENLRKAMTDAGFLLIKCDDRSIVMEDPEIRFERYNYLKKIIKSRQNGKHIYYIDEMHIEMENDVLLIRKPTSDDLMREQFDYHPKMFYVCSTDGCTNSLFSFCLAKGDYIKWIIHSLIPSLRPASVIVMDKSFLHGTPDAAHITRYHSKIDMIRWLEDRNIPCHASMHKAELFDLINKCPFSSQDGTIDRIFKVNGHEAVRLPCQLHQLSMSSPMLEEIKFTLRLKPKSSSLTDRQMSHLLVKLKISEAIKTISPCKWVEFGHTIQNYEKEFLNLDCVVEDLLDMNFNIDINELIVKKLVTCSYCNGKDHHIKISAT